MPRLVVVARPRVARPAKRLVDDAYENDASVVEELPNVWSAEKTLAVYTLGMVVEAAMYAFTPLPKSETCALVMERLLRVVILATLVVAARLPTNEVVARAVVK